MTQRHLESTVWSSGRPLPATKNLFAQGSLAGPDAIDHESLLPNGMSRLIWRGIPLRHFDNVHYGNMAKD